MATTHRHTKLKLHTITTEIITIEKVTQIIGPMNKAKKNWCQQEITTKKTTANRHITTKDTGNPSCTGHPELTKRQYLTDSKIEYDCRTKWRMSGRQAGRQASGRTGKRGRILRRVRGGGVQKREKEKGVLGKEERGDKGKSVRAWYYWKAWIDEGNRNVCVTKRNVWWREDTVKERETMVKEWVFWRESIVRGR